MPFGDGSGYPGSVMTGRLYYIDSHLFEFTAAVQDCLPEKTKTGAETGRWKIVLDETAFFPEGGGQPADTGILTAISDAENAEVAPDPTAVGIAGTRKSVRVLDAHEKDGTVFHFCDGPMEPGTRVTGQVDKEQRLRRMQNHSGEHILSGTAHRLYGCENVGFHMGEDGMTIDFDRELDADRLRRVETEANEAVRLNLPVRTFYPSPAELAVLEYRSKKELSGDVRIVEIPGVDRCACCAPHVSETGEVGLIKILEAERHRGGVRLLVVCGMQALDEVRKRQKSVTEISGLLSAKRDEVTPAVQRLLSERDALKEKYAALSMELVCFKAAQQPETEGNICLLETMADEVAVRELVNLLMPKCSGLAAVFFPAADGSLRYIIGSRSIDLRKAAKAINAGISGRGGGRPEMIQGSATGEKEEIRQFLLNFRA